MAKIDSGIINIRESNNARMEMLSSNKETKQYPLRIPTPLYKKVKIKLLREDKNLREVILEMLNNYIKE
jgi:hypothetical protein